MPTYTSAAQQETYFVEPGKYKVEILSAENAISSKGNDMIKARCRILLEDGAPGPTVTEYLVFTEKAAFKIDEFRKAMGQTVTPGESVTLEPEDIIGKILTAEIGEEPGSKNPDARFNTVDRWIAVPKPGAKASDGDDIPF